MLFQLNKDVEEGVGGRSPGTSARLPRMGVAFGYTEESAKSDRTLFGSLTSTYFPSGCFIHRSMIALMIPHPLASETFS